MTTLIDTLKRFQAHGMTDWAAALTYYAILAIFPALIALASVVGLLGDTTAAALLDNVEEVAPGPAKEIVSGAIQGLQENQGRASLLLVIGLLGALWSASGYVAAFMRASDAVHEIEDGRPMRKALPVRVGTTVVLMLLLIASALGVALTGDLANELGRLLGVGDLVLTLWGYLKWPVLMVLVSLMFAFLYWIAPSVERQRFRWLSAGGAFGVLVWLAASALFALYVGNFGSYEKTYGTLGGVITFLVWLWLSNAALLLGAELNAEVARRRGDSPSPSDS